MPAMTGQLKWATELKAKMSFSVKSFKDLNHPICYKEGAKAVFRKYKDMMALLGTYEDKVFEDWNQSITKKISQSLSRSLIYRDENRGILRVNFGRDLGSILREVKIVEVARLTLKLENQTELKSKFNNFTKSNRTENRNP